MSTEAKRQPEIPLILKTYDLVLWSSQHTARFPRSHRFVLGERIERRLYELLETLLHELVTLCFRDARVSACRVSIMKPDIFNEASGAGVEVYQVRGDAVE